MFPCMAQMGMEEQMMMPCTGMTNKWIARAYIPDQPYVGMFPLDEAFKKGVLFPNLYIPYPIKSME